MYPLWTWACCSRKSESFVIGFSTQSTDSFGDYVKKISLAVDYIKGKSTFGEMINLPNAYIHYFYVESYKRSIAAMKNPKGPEAEEIKAAAMQNSIFGQL